MDTGRTEKLSIAISVLFHALVFAGLALGLGGTSAGPVHQYVSVELFESPGGVQTPPAGPKALAAKPKRAPLHSPIHTEVAQPRVTKTKTPVEQDVRQTEEPVVQQAELDTSKTPDIALAGSDPQEVALYDPAEMLAPSVAPEAVMEGSGGEGQPGGGGQQDAVRKTRIGAIRSAIQSAVVYPLLARRRGLEGTVLASFFVDEKGTPRDVQVLQSSGYSVFDREVLRVIHAASPYPLVDIAVEVPVTFRLSSITSR